MQTLQSEQVLSMLQLQDQINSTFNPDWRNMGFKWTRAILVEAAAAIRNTDWRWGEDGQNNMTQIKMELVSIWQSLLSCYIDRTIAGDIDEIQDAAHAVASLIDYSRNSNINVVFCGASYDTEKMTLQESLELLAGMAALGTISVKMFDACLAKTDMSWSELYSSYIGKNCLKLFRLAHGNNDGSYIKDWSSLPLENKKNNLDIMFTETFKDSDHLLEIMQSMDLSATDIKEQVLNCLAGRYAKVSRLFRTKIELKLPSGVQLA
jgi:hypothetical protein